MINRTIEEFHLNLHGWNLKTSLNNIIITKEDKKEMNLKKLLFSCDVERSEKGLILKISCDERFHKWCCGEGTDTIESKKWGHEETPLKVKYATIPSQYCFNGIYYRVDKWGENLILNATCFNLSFLRSTEIFSKQGLTITSDEPAPFDLIKTLPDILAQGMKHIFKDYLAIVKASIKLYSEEQIAEVISSVATNN
jgi:hypothetical protein